MICGLWLVSSINKIFVIVIDKWQWSLSDNPRAWRQWTMLQCEHELHIWLVISASSDCIKWRWCCILTLVTEWILFTVTYFTPGFNEGALWALQMFESSGHLPFLQETIFLLDFYWCKWFCCLQEGMLSTTFPIPVDMCFLLPDYIQPCPQVSQCQA